MFVNCFVDVYYIICGVALVALYLKGGVRPCLQSQLNGYFFSSAQSLNMAVQLIEALHAG